MVASWPSPNEGARLDSSGFTFVELLAAIALLSIVIAPLIGAAITMQRAADETSARILQLSVAGPLGVATEKDLGSVRSERSGLWAWSPVLVEGLAWEPGGFRIRVWAGPTVVDAEVGWWIDGWFTGSAAVDVGSESVFLVPVPMHVPSDSEVVVRARERGGAWGAPWRTAVSREGSLLTAMRLLGTDLGATSPLVAGVVAHARGAGLSELRVRSSTHDILVETGQLPTAVVVEDGWTWVDCDGNTQTLRVFPGGIAHLYF